MEYTAEDIERLEKELLKEYNRLYYRKRRNNPNFKKYQKEKQKQYEKEKKTNIKPKHIRKDLMMVKNITKSNVIVKFDYDNLIVEI